MDDEFEKLFKVKVDFDDKMDTGKENELKIAQFISYYCKRKNIKHLDATGVAKVIEYCSRIAENQNKLSTRFSKIAELLIEADAWAEVDKEPYIRDKHIKKAYDEKIYRNNMIEEKMLEMYKTRKVIIDIKERKIGRINGLSVMNLGDHVFGKPSVITATTFIGHKGVINIEREVEMSGSIHDKGVMILEGYLSEKFAQDVPLSLTGKICFEQSYGGIDGDSASSTELYALLSSLGDVPLKQYIAVTGSVNQKGEIQPVGGVTEKIEGFFDICNHFGLTGDQGVMIPYQNIEDLVLKDEVIRAVQKGIFHIYPVSSIEEGIEILTDKSYLDIYERIKGKLHKYADSDNQSTASGKNLKRK
ncbi:Lon-insertion domain-containing protein [Geosporobacter ferrireducens]|uniref:endopeptidase La n=1 Tax=Geosporobacter ferrireducens TaxID=1424294 RepID=A0A1D8GNA3_9FIRM|nr:Lon-insertion domain-containing protein [Geosporobacter ferrireducens]AOT72364.1 hypothetical protein Gferi_24130 [Geosporobacter ferrireducens]